MGICLNYIEEGQGFPLVLPNGIFCRIGGSHFAAAENPEAFNRTVERFLRRR